jgi:NO-binding membrane sensor protein with MHYT domain
MAELPRRVKAALVLSGVGGLCFLGAAAVYQEPESFYTNFVLFPSLLLMLVGAVLDLIAIVMALFNLRGPARKEALLTIGIALLVPVISIATIQLVLRR